MRYIWASAAAILVVIALSPLSSWIFRSHTEILRGRFVDLETTEWNPRDLNPSDPDEELVLATFRGPQAVSEYARQHPKNPEAWALAVRYQMRGDGSSAAVSEAVEKGIELDPNNLYFALSRAAIASPAERSGRLEQAANCTKIDGYWRREAQARVAAYQRQMGYRGELMRAQLYAGIAFTDLSRIITLSKEIQKSGTLRDRLNLARCGAKMIRNSDTLIYMLVGSSMIDRATQFGSITVSQDPATRSREAQIRANAFAEKAKGLPHADEVPKMMKEATSLTASMWADGGVFGLLDVVRWPSIVDSGLLAAMLFCGLLVIASRFFSHARPASITPGAVPHLLSALVWLICSETMPDAQSAGTVLTGLALAHVAIALSYANSALSKRFTIWLAILAMSCSLAVSFPDLALLWTIPLSGLLIYSAYAQAKLTMEQRVRYGWLIGWCVVLATVLVGPIYLQGWAPAVTFSLCVIAMSPTRLGIAIRRCRGAAVGLSAGLMSLLYMVYVSRPLTPVGVTIGVTVFGFVVLSYCLSAFEWKEMVRYGGMASLFLATVYVCGIAGEVRLNALKRSQVESMLHEAEELRARAHIGGQ